MMDEKRLQELGYLAYGLTCVNKTIPAGAAISELVSEVRYLQSRYRAWEWLLAMVNAGSWINPPLPVGVELDPAYAEIAKQRVEEALAKGAANG